MYTLSATEDKEKLEKEAEEKKNTLTARNHILQVLFILHHECSEFLESFQKDSKKEEEPIKSIIINLEKFVALVTFYMNLISIIDMSEEIIKDVLDKVRQGIGDEKKLCDFKENLLDASESLLDMDEIFLREVESYLGNVGNNIMEFKKGRVGIIYHSKEEKKKEMIKDFKKNNEKDSVVN